MMPRRASRGFGLLEILIAAVVIGLGIVALTSLQGKFLKSASATSQREVALKLAQAKLDDLRSFTYDADPDGFGFNEITSNQGGRSGELAASSSLTYEQHNFGLGWTVADYKLVGGDYVAVTDPADKVAQKYVVINVNWTDSSGRSQTLSLPHTLSPTIPDTGTASSGGDVGLGGSGPTVRHQDAAAPDVIDIDLGDGSKRESSKPLPEVNAGDGIVLVQFDSINFDNSDSQKIVQEDNLTVSCSCYKSTASAERNNPVQLKWADEALYWEQIDPVTKQTGSSVVSGTDRLAVLCNRCCEDHFDAESGGSTTATDRLEKHYSYDSGRWGNRRYYLDNQGDFIEATGNKAYLEACRMMRINGYYVLMPDWQQAHQEVMTREHLSTSAIVAEYQGKVKAMLRDFASSSANYKTDPSSYQYLVSTENFPQDDVTIDPATSTRTQFMGRAVYIDPIENYSGTTSALPYNAFPFHEVNNTLLADWSLYSCNSTEFNPADPLNGCTRCSQSTDEFNCGNVALSNQPVAGSRSAVADADYYQGYYSRGELRYNTSSSGNYVVEVSSRKGNSGVTGTGPVSAYDASNVFTRHIGVSFGEVTETPGEKMTVGGRIFCYRASLNKQTGAFESWDACDKKTFNASVSTTIGSCPDQPVLQGSATPSFGCILPSDWIASGDGIDNLLRFSGIGANFHPEAIDEAALEAEAEKDKLCVVMIAGSVPEDATDIPSCSYDSGR
ncbi:hypothetical protein [Ferrimonas balearica]|uniref:hypothetical protein n=1 Tax=Ferrimonas balearica TaxID=44012 RepID=UPI001C9A1E9E|nr:hypothetical protein [Ferrimonas balearica]MBY5922805.1 hypothetical protein [Ferrimonas balearica]MBY5997818.1 hypothetical protein [Ferrimonas balearica]